jgi:fumarate reductase subunit D
VTVLAAEPHKTPFTEADLHRIRLGHMGNADELEAYHRLRHLMLDPELKARRSTWIYFMWAGNAVKIGVSDDPVTRRRHLQVANPAEVMLVTCWWGTHRLERAMHELFTTDRIRGEWYGATIPLIYFMRQVAALTEWGLDLDVEEEAA